MTSPIRHNSTLSTPPAELTPVQAQVVQALAAGRSVSAAAREARIHRSTIHLWLKEQPVFAAAVDAARENYHLEVQDELLDLASDALRTLRSIITGPDTPPAVRLRAALAILERPADSAPPWNVPAGPGAPELQQSPEPGTAVSRSAPCPCGSGQKYKRCCGRAAAPLLNAPFLNE